MFFPKNNKKKRASWQFTYISMDVKADLYPLVHVGHMEDKCNFKEVRVEKRIKVSESTL